MSSFPIITGPTSAQGSTDLLAQAATKSLSQQDFLNLLVAQMTAQDPLKPTDSQDLLSQMTEFSTLSANNNLQSQMVSMQLGQQVNSAGALLGKQVTLQVDASNTVQGTVTGIDTSASTPQIIVNGQSFTLDKVISISNPTTQ